MARTTTQRANLPKLRLALLLLTASASSSVVNAFVVSPPRVAAGRVASIALASTGNSDGDATGSTDDVTATSAGTSRRHLLASSAATAAASLLSLAGSSTMANAVDETDIDSFLRSGQVAMPMGVSGQAGKAKPVTGVVLRDGSEASRDTRTGNVLAEIVLDSPSSEPTAVLVSFSSPWSLAKGTVFDVECRDSSTGDGAFLAVTPKATGGKSIADLPSSFFLDVLFGSTGRFSFYGAPTDVKVKKSTTDGNYRFLEVSFATLSQSTNAEIPRNAVVAATVPEGTDKAVMLVGSATATRWKNKGAEKSVRETVGSFKAVASPSGMKVRAKDKTGLTNA